MELHNCHGQIARGKNWLYGGRCPPRELADACDIVVTMLADDNASQDVHFGPNGLFAGSRAKFFAAMGTIGPAHIGELVRAAPSDADVIPAVLSGNHDTGVDNKRLAGDHARGVGRQKQGRLDNVLGCDGLL